MGAVCVGMRLILFVGVAEAGAEAPWRKGGIRGAEAGALFDQNSPVLEIALLTELIIYISGPHLQSMLTASQGPGIVRLSTP